MPESIRHGYHNNMVPAIEVAASSDKKCSCGRDMHLVKQREVLMMSPGDVLAKAAERNWLYEGEHFLKVNSILQYNVVIVVHPNLLGSHLENHSPMVHEDTSRQKWWMK